MRPIPGLMALLLLPQPRPMYHWRDAQGQLHVTDAPPPPDAVMVRMSSASAIQQEQPGPSRSPRPGRAREAGLSPVQRAAWQALDQRMALARSRNDPRTLEAIADSLVDDCLWNGGLWARPVLPILAIAVMGLLGWWLALGQGLALRIPILTGFLLLGMAFGQMLLAVFLYQPQAYRLRRNLELLEVHLGGPALSPSHAALLQQRYRALQDGAGTFQPPWRFPAEVLTLRHTLKQVVVDP